MYYITTLLILYSKLVKGETKPHLRPIETVSRFYIKSQHSTAVNLRSMHQSSAAAVCITCADQPQTTSQTIYLIFTFSLC